MTPAEAASTIKKAHNLILSVLSDGDITTDTRELLDDAEACLHDAELQAKSDLD